MTTSNGVRVQFVTGPAGCGKSFMMRKRLEDDPGSIILCATTGVSAVNMDTVTINSVLGYYDTASLIDKYVRGYLHQRLRKLAKSSPRPLDIVIDEVSMMHAEQLDTIYKAIQEVNYGTESAEPLEHPLGLTLVADFCQLPPVKGRWAFQADCWPEFEANVNRLTKIWRQSDPAFLDAINAARRGDGSAAAAGLRSLGANFSIAVDLDFDGTTIVAKNDEADRFNAQRLLKIQAPPFALQTIRQGAQSSEWKNIPDRIVLKPGALVMLLANKKDQLNGGFQYVNGDLAHVVEYGDSWELEDWKGASYMAPAVMVTSVRTGETFLVERIVRENKVRDEPGPSDPPVLHIAEDGQYVIGLVDWFPMRLGYCSTIWKTQGLSLDKVQLDCRDGFFGSPNAAYVAISRARTVQGMRIVGGPEMLARRIKLAPEVTKWL